MYIGIGPERGKKVNTSDALSYAAERIVEDKETTEQFIRDFLPIFGVNISQDKFSEIVGSLEEWFYSGNWRLSRNGE